MAFKVDQNGIYIRIVALLSLVLGLSDAGRLLGVTTGEANPIGTMGITAFAYLGTFALARLFAAVGLWIKASWGAVLLVGATVLELVLYLSGSREVSMTTFGFGVRLVLLLSILLILLFSFRLRRASARD
ncbi:MAG TPA: hypothetical protein VGM83_16540 [Devosiaceae bacterium]|jgi:hypothetical protein